MAVHLGNNLCFHSRFKKENMGRDNANNRTLIPYKENLQHSFILKEDPLTKSKDKEGRNNAICPSTYIGTIITVLRSYSPKAHH